MCDNFVSCDVVLSLPACHRRIHFCTSSCPQVLRAPLVPMAARASWLATEPEVRHAIWTGVHHGLLLLRSPKCGARQMHGGLLLLMRVKCSPTQEHSFRGARQAHQGILLSRQVHHCLLVRPNRGASLPRREASASVHYIEQAVHHGLLMSRTWAATPRAPARRRRSAWQVAEHIDCEWLAIVPDHGFECWKSSR